MTTAIGYQSQHDLNNYTSTHLIVSSASIPNTIINQNHNQLNNSYIINASSINTNTNNNNNNNSNNINNNNININSNSISNNNLHHVNHHLSTCNTAVTTTTSITPANKPLSAKKLCTSSIVQTSLTNGNSFSASTGHKILAGSELLRCKRRNVTVRTVGYSGSPSQPVAVARRNERERNRVKMVNLGFNTLRQHIPNGSKNKKMSKVETLRSAVEYIRRLQLILNGETCEPTQYSSTKSVMPVDLKPSSIDENMNPTTISVCSPITSTSPSSMSSYESSQYIHETSPSNHHNLHHHHHHHHLIHSQCTNFDSQISPISPTSPKSSIASDISPSPYHHHLDKFDGMERTCTHDDSDIFDFASLLS